jgi:hypothetical protein
MDFYKLNKALSTRACAEYLYNLDAGKTLSQALQIAEANKVGDDDELNDDDADPLSLQQAMKHRKAPTGARSPIDDKKIILGKNKTKARFGGVEQKNTTRSFNNARSMSEDQLDNHRGAELPWISKKGNNMSKVQLIKNACAKARLAKESEKPYQLNAVMENFLHKKAAETRALKEGALTPAQKSIQTHPSAAEGSYKVPARVPSEFDSAAQRAADTKARIPAEFKSKSLSDQKAGQLRTWNDASRSLEHQPNHEQSPADGKSYGPNGPGLPEVDGMTLTHVPQPSTKTNSGQKSYTEKGQKKTRMNQDPNSYDLANPKDRNYGNMNS